jgi:hypothetical protein
MEGKAYIEGWHLGGKGTITWDIGNFSEIFNC